MARTRTLHGKREGWSVKLSKPKSDAADAMRGAMLRAHWLEALIDAALADDEAPPAAPPPEVVEDAIVPLERDRARKRKAAEPSPVEVVRALAEASGASLVPASQMDAPAPRPRGNCKHSSMRIRKGPCPDCGEWVTAKS